MLFCIMAIAAFAIQNLGCKEFGKRFPKTLYAQSVMLAIATAIVAVIMALLGGIQSLNSVGYLITFIFGVFFVMTIAAMTQSMNYGRLGLTVLIQNSSLMVPVLFGLIVRKEPMTLIKGIGIVCILILLALSAFSGQEETGSGGGDKGKWLFYTGLSFVGNSALSILQDLMSHASSGTDSVTFTFWTSLFSVVVAIGTALFCIARSKNERVIGSDAHNNARWAAICYAAIGVGTAGGNCFTIMALQRMNTVVLFPVRMGGLVLLMWALGPIIYHEKVTKSGLMMLVIGLIGIVLLNI